MSNPQCVSYAYARIEEKLNLLRVGFNSGDGAKDMINMAQDGTVVTSATSGEEYTIRVHRKDGGAYLAANSFAIYGGTANNYYGHVIYVEEVREIDGTKYVYFTEGDTKTRNNNTDGILKRMSVSDFVGGKANTGAYLGCIVYVPNCTHDFAFYGNYDVHCKICGQKYDLPEQDYYAYMDIRAVNSTSGTAPSHVTPYGDASISIRYNKGDTVAVVAKAENAFGNLWYKLSDGSWLVADYLGQHIHCINSDGICTECADGLTIIPLNDISLGTTESPIPAHSAPYGAAGYVNKSAATVTVTGKAVNKYGSVWYRLSDNTWVWAKYLSSPTSFGTVVNASGGLALNDKAAESPKKSKEIAAIPNGASVDVYTAETNGSWYSVFYNGKVGYVYKSYVSIIGSATKSIEAPGMDYNEEKNIPSSPSSSGSSGSVPSSSTASVSVSVNYPTDSSYLSKFKFTDTNAVLVSNIKKTSGSKCTNCMVTVWDENKNVIKTHNEKVTNVSNSNTNFHAWYDLNAELGLVLTPGTTYYYQFGTVVNGVTYYGKQYSFTTTGSKPSVKVVQPESSSPAPVAENKSFSVSATREDFSDHSVRLEAYVSYEGYKPSSIGFLLTPYSETASDGVFKNYYSCGDVEYDGEENQTKVLSSTVFGLTANTDYYYQIVWFYDDGTYGVSDIYHFVSLSQGSKTLYVDSASADAETDSVYIKGWMHYEGLQPDSVTLLFSPSNEMADGHLAKYYTPGTLAYNVPEYETLGYGADIAGLTPGTVYYYQFVWDYFDGTFGAGEVYSFTTLPETVVTFTDVHESDWFYEPVYWAVKNSVTTGTSATTFSPANDCTQAQILTFMYRAAGNPSVTISDPYSRGLAPESYYYNALLWAWEKGLVADPSFDPNAVCTRSDVVTYLWMLEGMPFASGGTFSDVTDPVLKRAVSWAVEAGVTNGTSDSTFSPFSTCTRSQIVTFLYRYYNR